MAAGCCSRPGRRRSTAARNLGGIDLHRRGFCNLRCRRKAAWASGHRDSRSGHISDVPAVSAGELIELAVEAGILATFGLGREAEVQALVLRRLGFRSGGAVLGQRPLKAEDFTTASTQQTLVHRLCGHNHFELGCLPLLKEIAKTIAFPSLLQQGPYHQFDITCVPTLELCAAICTRILCCATRLQKAESVTRLAVMGVERDTSILLASVVLHMGIVLQQAVSLDSERIELRLDPDFVIEFVAIGESQSGVAVIPLQSFDVMDSYIREGIQKGIRIFYLVDGLRALLDPSWIKQGDKPIDGVEEACAVSLPASMDVCPEGYPTTSAFVVTELFPKTLTCKDFLAQGFREPDLEAGLFHAHMVVQTKRKVPVPFLSPLLCHSKGPYDLRMKADKALWSLHKLSEACNTSFSSADALREPLPELIIEMLKEQLYNTDDAETAKRTQRLLSQAMEGCYDRAKKQLALLLKYSSAIAKGQAA